MSRAARPCGRRTGLTPVASDFPGDPHRPWARAERRRPVPSGERAVLGRLAAVLQRYPTLQSYVQGDPRGAALYLLRPGDVPAGADADAYYSRGVAVY